MSGPGHPPPPGWSGPAENGSGGPIGPGGPGGPTGRTPALVVVAAVLVLLVGGGVAVAMLQGDSDSDASCATRLADGCEDPETSGLSTTPTPTESTTSTTETTGSTTATTSTTSTSGAYCTQLSMLEAQLTKFQTSTMDTADLDDAITGLQDLEAVAPEDIRPQISTFLRGFISLRSLLDDLDLTFAQFQNPAYLAGHASGWTAGQQQRITTVTNELTAPGFTEAGRAIDADFRDPC